MIKKTLYFGNPVYLSLRNAQLVIKLPEIEKNDILPENFKQQSEITKPVEDIGIVVLDNKQITITSGVSDAFLTFYLFFYLRKKYNINMNIMNIIFEAVNIPKYFPLRFLFSFAIYLKLIRLAMDAISVPRPPILVPTIKAR